MKRVAAILGLLVAAVLVTPSADGQFWGIPRRVFSLIVSDDLTVEGDLTVSGDCTGCGEAGPGGGAPTDVDYLVGTADGDLSAEIVVGTTPGGVLGGTWASPTLDDAAVTLAKMANLAQDQFIGRTTGSTGVPETATITSAARGVLDDTTTSAMLTTLGKRHVYITGDQTAIGTSYADITGLSFPVEASKNYIFSFYIYADSDATTTGIDTSVNGPASPTSITYETFYWTSTTAVNNRIFAAYDSDTASTGSGGSQTKMFRVSGVLRNGANAGTLTARIKREAVGSGPNVRTGSWGEIQEVP